MIGTIILDSGPLGLIVHQQPLPLVIDCRAWLERHLLAGVQVLVPAIVVYELRRELLRLRYANSLQLLDSFTGAEPNRYLPLTDAQLRHAAELWANVRTKGQPTAHPHAIDIDVILAAQALSLGLPATDFVVATSNVSHFDLLVPAKDWQSI